MSAVNKSMMAESGECCQPGLAVAETGGEEGNCNQRQPHTPHTHKAENRRRGDGEIIGQDKAGLLR